MNDYFVSISTLYATIAYIRVQNTLRMINSCHSAPSKSIPVLYMYQVRHGAKNTVETSQRSLNTTRMK